MTASERKYFFIHVMKTAGATLRWHIRSNFKRFQVYPFKQVDLNVQDANYSTRVPDVAADKGRRRRIQVFTGHFPFVAVELLGMELTTITILRDPVERTLSYLRHCKRYHEPAPRAGARGDLRGPVLLPLLHQEPPGEAVRAHARGPPASRTWTCSTSTPRGSSSRRRTSSASTSSGCRSDFDELLAELEQRFGWQPCERQGRARDPRRRTSRRRFGGGSPRTTPRTWSSTSTPASSASGADAGAVA